MELKKQGAFFSIDALVAVSIIFLVIIIAFPIVKQTTQKTELHYDLLNSLSNLKVGEFDDSYVQALILEGAIQDKNNTLLEQIGEFYITNPEIAKNIGGSILNKIDTNENIGLWYETTLIASNNKTSYNPEDSILIDTARQTITGIQNGTNITGFSARAFLSSNLREEYFYFGGYVGDGNISNLIEFNGEIQSANLEIVINQEFNLYINEIFSGTYPASTSEIIPSQYLIPIENFQSGENIIEFKGEKLHIAGGFLKITYLSEVEYEKNIRYKFPGITGLINLYDGFYIPEIPNSLEIKLHLNTNGTNVLFNIGNKTIYKNSTNQDETIIFSNNELSSLLDYSSLGKKTIPLRLGLENVSFIKNGTGEADVFSVTDLSGSMAPICSGANFWCCLFSGGCSNSQSSCQSCGGLWEDKMQTAKDANYVFIDSVLNVSENRVGLIGYEYTVYSSEVHPLSSNKDSLKNKVDDWYAYGSTCICCGINYATDSLVSDSTPEKFRSMVVMSDGEANVRCSRQNTKNARNDAIQAACDAWEDHGITVYSVGFGSNADEVTLQSIASCGNGSYFYADIDELSQIYQQIAQNIIETSFEEQTIETSDNITTYLYPDSYIEFNYTSPPYPYGLIITKEEQFDNSLSCSFDIPSNITILNANVVSYSGTKWTDIVKINNNEIFNLAKFNKPFIELGDPYSIEIPTELLNQTNYLELTTAASKGNSTVGSESNKVIYTMVTNVSGFSTISANANGCNWNIEFEDNSNLSTSIPSNYSGDENCYYQSNRVEYNLNDAIQTAVYHLLRKLDFNLNNKVDTKFSEQNLEISTSEVIGIPFTWSTEVQVRVWR